MTPETGLEPLEAPTSQEEAGRDGDVRPPGTEQQERVRWCREDGCQAPEQFIRDSGWCRSHDPDLAEERRRASALGGSRTSLRWAKDRGIAPDELGPLTSPQDAARWAAIVAAGVASGRISASAGNSIRALLSEWRSAHDAAALQGEVDALRARLGRLAR